VRDDDLTAGEADIGEKAFVALNESAANQTRLEAHAHGYN
jgi:hypothetical protein